VFINIVLSFPLQLMPSPKWKLVVDIGDVEETVAVASAVTSANAVATGTATAAASSTQSQPNAKDEHDFGILNAEAAPAAIASPAAAQDPSKRDPRADEVIALLGEFMPSDPNSPSANYLSGYMSLRLLLLRQTWSIEEEELVRTILDSYTSYASGGRQRADIAMMLARDYIFLSQQQSQAAFLGYGQNIAGPTGQGGTSSGGLSLFGLPSTSSSLQNSPALTPIPAPGTVETMSIVSN